MEEVTSILVTGGAGFIGSHIVERLAEKNYLVTVPYTSIDSRSYFSAQRLHKKSAIVPLDITDRTKLSRVIEAAQIDFIFHLAAETIVTEAYEDPYTTLNTNIMGTVNLLEEVRLNSRISGMIVASTDKAYGKTTKKYTESSPLRGDHPYDVSKSAADLVCSAYNKTYQTPVVVTRFGNVYGEGDVHEDRIIPGIAQALNKGNTLQIRSDGTYVRDYVYVDDVADAYLFLFEQFNDIEGQVFNVSSSDTYSVLELVKKAEQLLGKKIPYKIQNTVKNEIPYQHLNDEKIRRLGWSNAHSLEDVLSRVVDWYRLHTG